MVIRILAAVLCAACFSRQGIAAVAFLAAPRTSGAIFRTQGVAETDGPHTFQPAARLIVRADDGSEQVLVPSGALDFSVCADGVTLLASVVMDGRADVYRINSLSGAAQRLTNGPGWNCQPVECGNGDIAFLSDRDNWRNPAENYRGFTIYRMNGVGGEVERVWHAGFGGVFGLHCGPDGRLYFSSGENQGGMQGAGVNWSIWSINPDGGDFRAEISLVNQFSPSDQPFDFPCISTDGSLIAARYYDMRVYGTLYRCPPRPRNVMFGPPRWPDNPPVGGRENRNGWQRIGMQGLTDWTNEDDAELIYAGRNWGHVSHPHPIPGNGVLLTWTGENGDFNMDLGVYAMANVNQPASHVDGMDDLTIVVDEPDRNEWMGKLLAPYREIFGQDRPQSPLSPHDPAMPPAAPFFSLGSSDVSTWNEWVINSQDINVVRMRRLHDEGEAEYVRILAMQPSLAVGAGAFQWVQNRYLGGYRGDNYEGFRTPTNERIGYYTKLIPLKKWRQGGKLRFGQPASGEAYLRRTDGALDTSFLVELPANQCWTFQVLDKKMQAIVTANTWHQGIPAGRHVTCQGCHAHHQPDPVAFEATLAASAEYPRVRLDKIRTIIYERDVAPNIPGVDQRPWEVLTNRPTAFESWWQSFDDEPGWTEDQRRLYRAWQDTGYLAAGKYVDGRTVVRPHGPYADTMKPTLVVRKHRRATSVGAFDPDSGIASLKITANGVDVTNRFSRVPTWSLWVGPPFGNASVVATARDGAGNITTIERIRVDSDTPLPRRPAVHASKWPGL